MSTPARESLLVNAVESARLCLDAVRLLPETYREWVNWEHRIHERYPYDRALDDHGHPTPEDVAVVKGWIVERRDKLTAALDNLNALRDMVQEFTRRLRPFAAGLPIVGQMEPLLTLAEECRTYAPFSPDLVKRSVAFLQLLTDQLAHRMLIDAAQNETEPAKKPRVSAKQRAKDRDALAVATFLTHQNWTLERIAGTPGVECTVRHLLRMPFFRIAWDNRSVAREESVRDFLQSASDR